MKRWFLFIFLALQTSELFSALHEEGCGDFANFLSPEAEIKPGSRLFVGLLVRLRNGQEVLAMSDYIGGGHRKLSQAIAAQSARGFFPKVEKLFKLLRIDKSKLARALKDRDAYRNEIVEYRWGGEILVDEAKGTIIEANETTGYLFGKADEPDPRNRRDPRVKVKASIDNLYRFLSLRRPAMIDSDDAFKRYDEGKSHILPFLSALKKKDPNARHRLANMVQNFHAFALEISEMVATGRPEAEIRALVAEAKATIPREGMLTLNEMLYQGVLREKNFVPEELETYRQVSRWFENAPRDGTEYFDMPDDVLTYYYDMQDAFFDKNENAPKVIFIQ